jgi:hypothetical protein
MNFSQLLAEKIDTIVHTWIEAVRVDRQISTADNLPGLAEMRFATQSRELSN